MKIAIAFVCVLFTAGTVLAQEVNYSIAKQQARRDSAQNDAEQQRIQREANGPASAPAAAPAPAPAPVPVDPAMQAALNNVTSLQSDFSRLNSWGSDKPDPAQKISLLNNLSQAAQGTKKVSADSIKKLADDLLVAMTGRKKLVAAQQTKLAREIHALFNSAHLTATQQPALLNDVQKILTDGGASLDDAVNVMTDLKQIVAETK